VKGERCIPAFSLGAISQHSNKKGIKKPVDITFLMNWPCLCHGRSATPSCHFSFWIGFPKRSIRQKQNLWRDERVDEWNFLLWGLMIYAGFVDYGPEQAIIGHLWRLLYLRHTTYVFDTWTIGSHTHTGTCRPQWFASVVLDRFTNVMIMFTVSCKQDYSMSLSARQAFCLRGNFLETSS